ncbi:MAG: hypothetical protein AAF322_13660 [Pseudomonadota bacterium]
MALADSDAYSGFDRIVFDASLSGAIRLTLGTLGVSSSMGVYGEARITITGDVEGDDTIANGFTDVLATAASELDDNTKLFSPPGAAAGASPTLDGLNLTGGRSGNYGGAIDAYGTDLTINDVNFVGNVVYNAVNGGGAVYSGADLTITNSSFVGNVVRQGAGGGAIYKASGGPLTLMNVAFADNAAYNPADDAAGGAIHIRTDGTLTNVTITGNYAEGSGGGLFSYAGEVRILTDSVVSNNRAGDDGGGVFVNDGDVTLTRVEVTDNDAAGDGGGLFARGEITLTEVEISRNEARGGRS